MTTYQKLRLTVGRTIRTERRARDWTLAETSAKVGISLGYLSQVECGKNMASIEVLLAICELFEWSMTWLFSPDREAG